MMQHFRQYNILGAVGGIAFFLLLGVTPTAGQSSTTQTGENSDEQVVPVGNLLLRKTSYEVARQVCSTDKGTDRTTCVVELIKELGGMDPKARCEVGATRALILRQEITEMIQTASLQVDGFLAEVDSETAHIRAVHDGLTDRRDRAVQYATGGNAGGTAGSSVGSSLALASATSVSRTGNIVAAVLGGVGAGFGIIGFVEQYRERSECFPYVKDPRHPKEKVTCYKLADKNHPVECQGHDENNLCDERSDSPAEGCSPRMLVHLIDRSCKDPKFHSSYDDSIDNFLFNSDRGAALTTTWSVKQPPSTREERKESYRLTASNAQPRKLSIDDLSDRANKLADLRTQVALMNRDLGRLSEDLAKDLRCR